MSLPRSAIALLLGATLTASARAQPDSAIRRPFQFAVLGHIRGNASGALSPKLPELLDRVRALRPDFVVLTGDIVWGDIERIPRDSAVVRRQWDEVDSALATLGAPVFRVPGNHDISDLRTKQLWLARYGPVSRVLERYGSRFLLVASAAIPADGDTVPLHVIRPEALDAGQAAWLKGELARTGWDHTFLLMHHLLWWRPDAPWWREIHPLLAPAGVRIVFGGDLGPLKFSHLTRDSVLYLQSSVEAGVNLRTLQNIETSRVMSAQFDNFLFVRVDGPAFEVQVKTLAELSSPQYEPAFYQAVMPPAPPQGWRKWLGYARNPRRLAVLGALGALAFFAGWWLGRRRSA